jgi:hypothetical protein
MTFRIEHALVMDTDHLRGGGGYSVATVSPGVTEAERVFVAENFGISDFLHDPRNDRVYFSVFRVPGGQRTAFVRRFAKGTRRNGVQSRLFVHTLFLEEDLLERLVYLPWLLIDRPLTMGGNEIFLSTDPEPLQHGGSFAALEWDGEIATSDAFEQLAKNRYEPLISRFRENEELAAFDPKTVVASALDRISRGQRVELAQGPTYEQLSMVIWSMLPPSDRMDLAWTQHESGNTAITFAIANLPSPNDAMDFVGRASEWSLRLVGASTKKAEAWADMQEQMAKYRVSVRDGDAERWLHWSDARQRLFANPKASDKVLTANLKDLADSVSDEKRERWVNEIEVLSFLLSLIPELKQEKETIEEATERLARVYMASGIANVIFRVVPPPELLDEYGAKFGVGPLIDFFLLGSEGVKSSTEKTLVSRAAAATRSAVAAWLLECKRADSVDLQILSRFVMRLALDRSDYRALLQRIVLRTNGLRGFAKVLTREDERLGDAVLTAVMMGIQSRSADTASFITGTLLPRLEGSAALAARISVSFADQIAAVLRTSPEDFASFASRIRPEAAFSLVSSVENWLVDDRSVTFPLARAILIKANRGGLRGVPVDELALLAAERGEATALWLPAALDAAARLDESGDPIAVQAFCRRLARLSQKPAQGNADALRQVVSALQRAARGGRAGVCTLALVRFTRPWSDTGSLADALQTAIAGGGAKASEWTDIVADLVQEPSSKNAYLAAVAGGLLLTYWNRLSASEFGGVTPPLVDALPALNAEGRERMVSRWLPLLCTLPEGAFAERFIDTLTSIASDRLGAEIEVARSWREIEHDAADAETLARLDMAIRASGKSTERPVREAIDKIIKRIPGLTDRAVWLVHASASSMTAPTTRRIIERHFLSGVLSRLDPQQWQACLSAAGDDVFVHGNILLTVASELALSKADDGVRGSFQRKCMNHGRTDALAVAAVASRGLLDSISLLGSKSMELFRGEAR